MQTITPELQEAIGAEAPEKGALVAQVREGSSAASAGLQAGDAVLRVAGKQISDSHEAQQTVLEQEVGEEVSIGVWRDGKEIQSALCTAELPADAGGAREIQSGEGELGLRLGATHAQLSDRLGLEPRIQRAV